MKEFLTGRIARELSFYRIREKISSFAKTEEGRERVNSREPCDDNAVIEKLKSFGREWSIYLDAQKKDPITYVPDIHHLLPVFETEGSSLTTEQLYALGQFCSCVLSLQKSIKNALAELDIPSIALTCSEIPDLKNAEGIIFSVLDADGQMRDLPELQEIRAQIIRAQKEIDAAIKRYTADSSLGSSLQSKVPALKSGRQLLAVRADRRGDIHGIVHEVSASGQTVFIEPEEAVRANNNLVQAEFKLQAAIRKILLRTTAELAPYKYDFSNAHETLLFLDETFAAAKWKTTVGGIFAEACKGEQNLTLVRARHPLLGDSAVPIDVAFLPQKTVLIITGPNTGGKTVTLKTIALFALLNQAGFPVPAEEGTRLPVFSSVFADIGDDQSIDESLSTFSSHMKNIAEMINHADKNSLILVDELGSGTDMHEGGAIAMATLDTLIERQSLILVTTHHGILKNYGYTRPQCINASVEFDANTLRPTYRIVMGIPGESHALDIALNSGLPEHVVTAAKKYIDSNEADVSELIKGLGKKHAELDALISEQEENKFNLEKQKLKLLEKEEAVKEKELALKEEEQRESRAFVRETRSKLENLVREIREGEITREKTLSVRNFINEISSDVEAQEKEIENHTAQKDEARSLAEEQKQKVLANGIRLSSAGSHKSSGTRKTKKRLSNAEAFAKASVPEASAKKVQKKPLVFEKGAQVVSKATKAEGTLLEEVKPHVWSVQFGSVKMTVAESNLALTKQNENKILGGNTIIVSEEKPKFELRLLGMRSEEALKSLEHQIDLCMINSFKNFSVIHGKGNGILQQAVHDYLSHAQGIKNFYFAKPEDGGTGKTYVELF